MKASKNKIIAAAVSFAVIAAIVISLLLIGNGGFINGGAYSETFTGCISEKNYISKEAAARAFVAEELSGQSAAYYYNGYTKTGELTDEELEAINGQNAVGDTIYGGDKVRIAFGNAETDGDVGAYLLETATKYRYFVLPPELGEPVTNAYLNSVLDGNSYINCTATSTVSISALDIMNTYMQVIQFDDDKAYFKQELPGLINDVYLQEYSGGLIAYMQNPDLNDGVFYTMSELKAYYYKRDYSFDLYLMNGNDKISVSSLNSMLDVVSFTFNIVVDASYFVKQSYGFSMTDNNFKEFLRAYFGDEIGDLDTFWEDYKVYFRSDYYVSEGRLSETETILRLMIDGEIFTLSVVTSYNGFGTTEVVIPERG